MSSSFELEDEDCRQMADVQNQRAICESKSKQKTLHNRKFEIKVENAGNIQILQQFNLKACFNCSIYVAKLKYFQHGLLYLKTINPELSSKNMFWRGVDSALTFQKQNAEGFQQVRLSSVENMMTFLVWALLYIDPVIVFNNLFYYIVIIILIN